MIQNRYKAVKGIMLGIMAACVLSITANIGATLKEAELQKYYAERDYAIMTQVALLRVDRNLDITPLEIIEEADRIAGINN